MITRTINGSPFEFLPAEQRPADVPSLALVELLNYQAPLRPFWRTGSRIEHLQEKLLASIPFHVPNDKLPDLADQLMAVMRSELVAHSQTDHLSVDEIDTTVLDFRDLLMPGIYALIEQRLTGRDGDALAEPAVYVERFLSDTSYWGSTQHTHQQDGRSWTIEVAYDHFGPFGLRLTADDDERSVLLYDDSAADPLARPLVDLAIAVLDRLFPTSPTREER